MIKYLTISTFRKKLSELLKVRRNVYSGIEKEIFNEFCDSTIESIRNNRDMILVDNEALVIKLRLPDKKQRLSRKDGYRLIYLVSKQNEVVTFLTVYPKNGPCQQLSITREDLKILLNEFISEASRGNLQIYQPLS